MSARVLVVDDVPVNVRLLEAKLSAEYYEVLTANDGPQALEIAAEQMPDIILLDVMMPDMDGFEVCRRLKADASACHIPVVMITALSDVADRVKGLEAGADDFLSKPVDDVALFARVRSLLRVKMMLDELRGRQATSGELGVLEDVPLDSLDEEPASVLLVDEDTFGSARIREFLEAGGHSVEVVTDAETALSRGGEDTFDLAIIGRPADAPDGLRLCSQLRSQESTRHLPLVLMFDEMDSSRICKALDLGANDYLVKPVDRGELLARTRTQVRRRRYHDRLRSTLHDSVAMAFTDPLTGLYNRRYATAHLDRKIMEVAASGKPVSVAIFDIDHFKQVNDTFGHAAGDEVLQEVARRAADVLRSVDLVARYGGEEFVVMLSGTEEDAAMAIAERVRACMAATPFAISCRNEPMPITVSVGVATTRNPNDTVDTLLGHADGALYAAKRGGRNRVRAADDAEEAPQAVAGRA